MTEQAELLAVFARDFGVPFLRGQQCVVGSPLGREGAMAVRHGLLVDPGLEDACAAQVMHAACFVDVAPGAFDADAGTLLYAVHELFACTHPQASSFYARAHLFCRAAMQAVQELPRTFDPGVVLTRHLIVDRALQTTRTDVVVRWWTGSAHFFGEEPSPRLLAWPGLRRVNIDRTTKSMWQLALASGDEELRLARLALLEALLEASPLTRLTTLGHPITKHVSFSLLSAMKVGGKASTPLDCLEDRRIARLVVDAMMAQDMLQAGAPLAFSILQALREGCPPRILVRAMEVCVHLALVACFIETDSPGASETKALKSLLDENIAAMDERQRGFWAVVAAAMALDRERLVMPALEDLPPDVAALWSRVRQRLSHERVLAVAKPLERELSRRVPLLAEQEADAPTVPR